MERDEAMKSNANEYENEPIRYPPLQVLDLLKESAAVTEPYRNLVLSQVNDSCLRLAVLNGEYRWHEHPTSDELFIVIDGCLVIEIEGGQELKLLPWQTVTIPAGIRHRTRAEGRTVNLCLERLAARTIFVKPPRGLLARNISRHSDNET
jgi:mannose-6-phosphate isomerase-like protein (cupin superfamily)